ncbi:RNA polymerase sigma factor for flagellar operon FliA [Desulfosarcina sp. BuS5]|uniref:FliA/WhiG family RNA polymerase sigma factor n=1 Tax=Desulfosarcina sp. BuS5 TaxID=933262 RepID=UPI000486BD73|nr:FliA/WhiG family RNA polymerase sigma factor [Desulfosarcina sp. BuS5]WDN90029.1 RNA polymerase sigma factor for flagellar operon FliA [Desulfosarcina sp. BuS5]
MEPAGLIAETNEHDDSLFRKQLINKYLPYVKRIVYRIAINLPSNIIEIDDLVNAGVIGLIQAVDRYDPERKNKFITYAVYRIKGAVLSELRSRDFLSRDNRKKIRELEMTCLKLEQQLGREANDIEVAADMGLSIEQFYKIKQNAGISFISFEDLGISSIKEKEKLVNSFMQESETDAFSMIRLKEIKDAISCILAVVPVKEKLVISLYYQDELTMKEIGKVLDITESRVSQIHAKAIIHLRERLRNMGILDK